jgi:hypothetical protein
MAQSAFPNFFSNPSNHLPPTGHTTFRSALYSCKRKALAAHTRAGRKSYGIELKKSRPTRDSRAFGPRQNRARNIPVLRLPIGIYFPPPTYILYRREMDAFFTNPRRGKKRPTQRGGRQTFWRFARGNIVKDRNVFFMNGI